MNGPPLPPNLVDGFDRLSLNQLSKSSPSRLPPFQLKRTRSQQAPALPVSGSDAKYPNGTSQSKQSNLSHVPCKFFKQGTCTAGANCIFSHNPDPTSESAVCKYFLKGNCKFGNKCALLHTMSSFAPDGRKSLAGRTAGNTGSHHPNGLAPGHAGSGNDLSASYRSLDFGSHLYSSARGGVSDAIQHDGLSSSADGRQPYSHLSAAIHRHDPFGSSAPSHPASLSFLEEQRRAKQTGNGMYVSMDYLSGVRTSSSPRGDVDLSSSPFGPSRSLFLHPSSSSVGSNGLLSSSLSRMGHSYLQGLQRIPEGVPTHYLDIPHSNGNYFDQDADLNDAMLPSSLNDLLTPTELQLRKAREHATQKAVGTPASSSLRGFSNFSPVSESMRGYRSPLATQPLDMAHSPFESLALPQQQASPWQAPSSFLKPGYDRTESVFEEEQDDHESQTTTAINIPGSSSKGQMPTTGAAGGLQDEYTTASRRLLETDRFSLFTGPSADDDDPFYMEDTGPVLSQDANSTANATLSDLTHPAENHKPSGDEHRSPLTPFEFPSLVSLPKSS